MRWIYLSPHFDDAALSCGGLIWEQVKAGGTVEVWTICAGEPPAQEFSVFAQELHTRWGLSAKEAIARRRQEDQDALERLGAQPRYFSLPDAVYRVHSKTGEHLYPDWEAVIGGMHPGDEAYLNRMLFALAEQLEEGEPGEVAVAAPLTLGNHVDHLLTRGIAERLRFPLWYYPDYPYVLQYADEIPLLAPIGAVGHSFSVTEEGLAAWQESVAAYVSQLSTFWNSDEEMRQAITDFAEKYGGVLLYHIEK